MQEFPVDVAPEQILRWIKAELSDRPHEFHVAAEREFVAAEDLDRASIGIGPDTDVASVAMVGVVEIRSAKAAEEWVLRVRAEDVVGDHLPEDHSVEDSAEAIDIETFEKLFLNPPGQSTISAVLLAPSARVVAHLSPMFEDIRKNRHPD